MQNTITKQQADALDAVDLPAEKKEQIRKKYWELAKQFPHMKRHRLMRKAAEMYHVKIVFEK